MQVAAVVILVLALASFSVSAPVSNVVDWDAVMVEVNDIEVLMNTAVFDIKKLVSDNNEEIGQEVTIILDAALIEVGVVLTVVKEEVRAMTLTAGQARAHFYEIDTIAANTKEQMKVPLAELEPTVVTEVENMYDNMSNDIENKEDHIIYLLSVDA